jgi:hypothetical protein
LVQEKTQLERQLENIHSLYNQLVGDQRVTNQTNRIKKKEELNDRRSMLYQSQIIQLKRQLGIYKEIAQKKELFVYSAQEQANLVLERFQKYVASLESSQKIPELESLFKRLEALAKHISRQERDNIDNLSDPQFQFISDFVSPKSVLTLHKASDGSIDHLNVEQVARLDVQLQSLYGKLSELEASLSTSFEPNVAPLFQKQVQTVFEASMNELVGAMNSLLSVSTLLPAAPIPSVDRVTPLNPVASSFEELFQKLSPPISETVLNRIRPVFDSLIEEFRTKQVISFD